MFRLLLYTLIIKIVLCLEQNENFRLPRHILPESYDVNLIPSFKEGNFTLKGDVTIKLLVQETSKNITLHANHIMISKIILKDSNNSNIHVALITRDKKKQFYIAKLKKKLVGGSVCYLYLEYEGELNDKLVGFYRSSYKDNNGTTRWLGATQFQAIDARRAFPCFDDLDFKARFKISMARPKHMNSISNMPLNYTTPFDGRVDWEWDHFEDSVRMSSYLVAFVVSDFGYKDATLQDSNTTVRIYARQNSIDSGLGDFAADVGPRILKFFEEYYGIPYALPKLDMVAIPDFSAGGMENWGLIIFKENVLLYDKDASSASTAEDVVSYISHEVAHMWFGNLVTAKWWNDIWLNEGFASYAKGLGVNSVRPEWRAIDDMVDFCVHTAMNSDGLSKSHPLSVPVTHPDQITDLSGIIIYRKGCAILRMVSSFLTEETFKTGIKNYLNKYAFSNADKDDLWEELTLQGHADSTLNNNITIKEIMDTWTTQAGYPLLTVSSGQNQTITACQEEFSSVLVKKQNASLTSWWIPVTYTTDFSKKPQSAWISDKQKCISFDVPLSATKWIIFNVNQTSYYRTNYDAKNWKLISEQLLKDFSVFPEPTRSMLLSDVFQLAKAGQLKYDIPLGLIKYLPKETAYLPLKTALSEIKVIVSMFERSPAAWMVNDFVKSLLIPIYDRIANSPWERTGNYNDIRAVFMRNKVMSWACKLGHSSCIILAKEKFNQVKNSYNNSDPDNKNNQINPDLKKIVYCNAVRYGSSEEWTFLWQHYQLTKIPSEKSIVLRALACSRDLTILTRYLSWALDDTSGIRNQDGTAVFSYVASNPIMRCLVWDDLRDNWKKYYNKFGIETKWRLKYLISAAVKNFHTKRKIDELKKFAIDNADDLSGITRAVDEYIERAESNPRWITLYYQFIVDWFSGKKEETQDNVFVVEASSNLIL